MERCRFPTSVIRSIIYIYANPIHIVHFALIQCCCEIRLYIKIGQIGDEYQKIEVIAEIFIKSQIDVGIT